MAQVADFSVRPPRSAGGACDAVAFLLQEDFEQLPNRTLIVDNQNLGALWHLDFNREGRPHSLVGPDGNRAVVCINDLRNDRETQSGPIPERGIERNE